MNDDVKLGIVFVALLIYGLVRFWVVDKYTAVSSTFTGCFDFYEFYITSDLVINNLYNTYIFDSILIQLPILIDDLGCYIY